MKYSKAIVSVIIPACVWLLGTGQAAGERDNTGEAPASSTPAPDLSHGPLAGFAANIQSSIDSEPLYAAGSVRTLSGTGCNVNPQANSNMGTDFILAFMPNLGLNHTAFAGHSVELHLTAPLATSVTIQYPVNAPTFNTTVALTPGDITIVTLPVQSSLDWVADQVSNNSIHVFADDAFVVYMVNRAILSSDAALALPVAVMDTAYVVIDYGATFSPEDPELSSINQFVVYALEDFTTVTIVPVAPLTGGHPAGVPFDVVLNRGEGYYAEGASVFPNMAGTTVSSDRPVGLTNGNRCTFIPEGNPWCDHIFEVAQPVQTWGTQVFVGNRPNQPNGMVYRIVASEDGTTINQNGSSIGTINLGEFIEVGPVPGIHIFSGDKAIFVVQYMIGVSSGIGDPSMGNVISPEQYLSSYVFSTVGGSQFAEHFVTVIAEDADLATIELDGIPIGAANFTSIPGTGFSGVNLRISEGVHCTSSNGVHGITVEGYNVDDTYFYPGGASFGGINETTPCCLPNNHCIDSFAPDCLLLGGTPQEKGTVCGPLTCPSGQDCNNNGIDDAADIWNETSGDCNFDGIPDECEPDCNGTSIPDSCDIVAGTSQDCNGNGIPDECEADCNGNGVADSCDIADGTSGDCDGNSIPDDCELDTDGDEVIDACDNCVSVSNLTQDDFDGDGMGDACDDDVDDDGIPNAGDVCPFTRLGSAVDAEGRPLGDIDRDCDTDLIDYGLLQRGFTGPQE